MIAAIKFGSWGVPPQVFIEMEGSALWVERMLLFESYQQKAMRQELDKARADDDE